MNYLSFWICCLCGCALLFLSTKAQIPVSVDSIASVPSTTPATTKVIVVGAGAAGLAASQRLLDKGFQVTLLEASGRTGGRVWTVPTGNGFQVELGADSFPDAESVSGPRDEVLDWAFGHGFLDNTTSNQPDNLAYFLQNKKTLTKLETEDAWATILETVISDSSNNNSGLSVGSRLWLQAQSDRKVKLPDYPVNVTDAAYDYLTRTMKATAGLASLLDLGSIPPSLATSTQRNLQPNRTFSDILTTFAPNATAIAKLGMMVTSISLETNSTDGHPLKVTTSSGVVFSADHVILTVSLGHLKQSLQTLFSPPLSDRKQAVIQATGFGTQAKITLVYNTTWWRSFSAPSFQAVFLYPDAKTDNADLEKLYKNDPWTRAIPGFEETRDVNNSLTFVFGGPQAVSSEALTDTQIIHDLTELLQTFLPSTAVPAPDAILRAKWRTNPLFMGSHSYPSSLSVHRGYTMADLAAPDRAFAYDKFLEGRVRSIPGLLFAGEATSPHLFSTVSGAILSGVREANRLLMIYTPSIVVN